MPMSSPMMTTMLGFCGCCADAGAPQTIVAAHRANATPLMRCFIAIDFVSLGDRAKAVHGFQPNLVPGDIALKGSTSLLHTDDAPKEQFAQCPLWARWAYLARRRKISTYMATRLADFR